MARPRLEPGTFGTICTVEVAPGRWKGDGRYRTMAGKTMRITATGSSAEEAIANVKAKAPGGPPPAPKADVTPASTLGELTLAWLDSRDARREADVRAGDEGATTAQTLSRYREDVERWVVGGFGDLHVGTVTAGVLQRRLAAVQREKGSWQANRVRMLLGMALAYAVTLDVITENPIVATTKYRRPTKTVVAPSLEQVLGVVRIVAGWEKARVERDARNGAPFLAELLIVGAETGLRIGELLALRACDILDVDGGTRIDVCGTMVQADKLPLTRQPWLKQRGQRRHIIVSDGIGELLVTRRAGRTGEAPLWPARGGMHRAPHNVRTRLRTALRAHEEEVLALGVAALEDVIVHAMRRHAATRIARSHGVDAAASTLAHSSVVTTSAHYLQKETVVFARGDDALGDAAAAYVR